MMDIPFITRDAEILLRRLCRFGNTHGGGTVWLPAQAGTAGARLRVTPTRAGLATFLRTLRGLERRGEWLLEDNLAVAGSVTWKDGDEIIECSLQAVFVDGGSIDDVIAENPSGESAPQTPVFRYRRLDIDNISGNLFTHPYPHIHSDGYDDPRSTLNGWVSPNVVVDFIESLYLDWFHGDWLKWAEKIWNEDWDKRGESGDDNPFVRIAEAFSRNDYGAIKTLETNIVHLKRLLRGRKDALFPLRIDTARRDLLAYPTT